MLSAAASQAQVNVLLDGLVSIQLPAGAQKITSTEAIPFVISKLNSDKVDLNTFNTFKKKYLYLTGNVLVDLSTGNKSVKPNHLEALKRGLDEMHRGDLNYSSVLQADDNKSVLVYKYIAGDIQRLYFISFDTQNAKSIGGSTECNVVDATEGKRVFDMIVKSLKFQ